VTSSSLPIADFDHLSLGDLESRIRALGAGELNELISFELAHAARVPVLQLLGARRDELSAGAAPSGGDPRALDPLRPRGTPGGSKVSPATSGPPMNPPSQGDPTNPAQPRT
jgi:hypothetical protein